jgi:hypothetical protein
MGDWIIYLIGKKTHEVDRPSATRPDHAMSLGLDLTVWCGVWFEPQL